MSNHTPGPWAVDRDPRPRMSWNNHIVSEKDPDQRICFMTHDGTKENERGQANASLVAAAPDLLHALKELMAAVKGEPAMNNHKYDGVGIVVNAAIAKAEGRS